MVKSYKKGARKCNPTICPGGEFEMLGGVGRQHETGVNMSRTSLNMRKMQSHMVTQLSFYDIYYKFCI